jgi:hypothetical protein
MNIASFEEKYKAKVVTSQNANTIFVALKMDGKFFEADNTKMIEKTDENIVMLKDIIDLIKKIAASITY